MATVSRTDGQPSMTALVSGILDDIQTLIQQQLALFQREIQEDFRKSREASMNWVVGVALVLPGLFLLIAMLVGFLEWSIPAVPWWGWCGIVGGVLSLTAGVLFFMGKKQFESFNPLPNQSVEALKENLQCLKPK